MTVRLGFAASLLLLFLFLSSAFRLDAQAAPASPQTPPTGTATGVVRTSEGVGVPGATLRLVETATGRAWVTWTDENGHFDLPALPQGHYRIEVSQLGFDNATQEFDLGGTPAAVNVPLKVASLQSCNAAARACAECRSCRRRRSFRQRQREPRGAQFKHSGSQSNCQSKSPARSRTGLRRRRGRIRAQAISRRWPAPAQARMARRRRPDRELDRQRDRQLDQRAHQRGRAAPFSK